MNTATLTQQLKLVFANGVGSAGLEVGADPGLDKKNYVLLPASMKRRTLAVTDGKIKTDVSFADLYASDNPHIHKNPRIVYVRGEMFVKAENGNLVGVVSFLQEDPKGEALLDFIHLNKSHCGAETLNKEDVVWVLAIRYWAAIHGFITVDKNSEYEEVPAPAANAIVDEDYQYAEEILKLKNMAITACAARAASWRKTNHCTGGLRAQGFVKKWLETQNKWPKKLVGETQDIVEEKERRVTRAFYNATHAVSNHAVLAIMAPDDEGHWADIDTNYGLVTHMKVLDSVKIRISPKTQIAGTAIVVDSVEVLKMLSGECISGLLMNTGQLTSLAKMYNVVKENGVRVGVYANWFLDGHPDGLTAIPFSQKDGTISDICGELATIATVYYKGTTIAASPALMNAAQNQGADMIKTTWTQIAKSKEETSGATILKAYTRIRGGLIRKDLTEINGSHEGQIRNGVATYNRKLKDISDAFGFSSVMEVDIDEVLENIEDENNRVPKLDTESNPMAPRSRARKSPFGPQSAPILTPYIESSLFHPDPSTENVATSLQPSSSTTDFNSSTQRDQQ